MSKTDGRTEGGMDRQTKHILITFKTDLQMRGGGMERYASSALLSI